MISFLSGLKVSAQLDTIFNEIDTVLCSELDSVNYIHTPYDTAEYNSEWYYLEIDTAFSTADSLVANDLDTLLLFSIPKDTNQSAFLDTLIIQLRFYPMIDLEIPTIECYQEDTLEIKDNSIIFGDYTSVSYNQIGGSTLTSLDSLIKVIGTNGELIQIQVEYEIEGCSNIIDTLLVGTKFQPVAEFMYSAVCFGDTTVIFNESEFDSATSTFLLEVEGITSFNTTQDSFEVYLPINGDTRDVFVEINQEGCIENATFSIKNNLQPVLNFDVSKTCENELIEITNSSSGLTQIPMYDFIIFDKEYETGQFDKYLLGDTFPNGKYDLLGVVDNQNGCKDSLMLEVTIDSVTYISFEGLDATFCEQQDSSLLIASTSGGQFSGQYINDLNNGSARFVPTSPDSNIQITYSFENDLQCTDIDTQYVQNIYPKPILVLDNLSDAYCLFDPLDTLMINQNNQATSLFEIRKDGQLEESLYTLSFVFNPEFEGAYSFFNFYTDENGCFNSLLSNTKVNRLPGIAVDSITVIQPGEEIILGDGSVMEPNVEYEWSNGSIFPSIEVDQPGIYILNAINLETLCMAGDTAKIAFDSLIETELVEIQIRPNPTMDFVDINLSSFVQNIRIVDVFGELVSLNGSIFFNTDNDGELALNLSNQSPGYYYLLVPDVGNFLIVKI